MVQIDGTLGPSCADPQILRQMFELGMTGIRVNLSHTSLRGAAEPIGRIHEAARSCGRQARLLIDMQGPELRIGRLDAPTRLTEGDTVDLGPKGIHVPRILLEAIGPGQELLLDDGKLLLRALGRETAEVVRGGLLTSGKSVAAPGCAVLAPVMTEQDRENVRLAVSYGVTEVMQPFVRSADDLRQVRQALDDAGGKEIRLLAKIEDLRGVEQLESFFGLADEIVIARGDLGNAMPLWELPSVQAQIS